MIRSSVSADVLNLGPKINTKHPELGSDEEIYFIECRKQPNYEKMKKAIEVSLAKKK